MVRRRIHGRVQGDSSQERRGEVDDDGWLIEVKVGNSWNKVGVCWDSPLEARMKGGKEPE